MKKILFYILFCMVIFSSCKMELDPYNDIQDRAAFVYKKEADSLTQFTFAYYTSNVTEGVVNIEVTSIGFLSDRPRKVAVIQSNSGANAAQPGVHYEMQNEYTIEAYETEVTIPLKVLRDASLKTSEYMLEISIVANDDFTPGYLNQITKYVQIADQLTKPGNWNLVASFFGSAWGPEKHKIMILAAAPFDIIVDEEWIRKIGKEEYDYGYLLYWKNVFRTKLNEVNAERAKQGLETLREAPEKGQDTGTLVAF